MGAQDSKFAHTPIMTVDLEFSWPQFLWIAFIFVGVPTTIGASIIWTIWRSERTGVEHSTTALDAGRTGSGPLGLWRTGLLAFALAFCLVWAGSAGQPTTKADSAAPACLPRRSFLPGRCLPAD